MAIRISEVRSSKLSEDQKEVIVASTGKYTGDLELRFARECIDQLIDLLGQAKKAFEPSAEPSHPPALSIAAAGVPALPVAAPKSEKAVAAKADKEEVRFEIPKNFTVTADNGPRGLVLMIVNHRLENQNGYAFSAEAAKQVAGGLIKSAEASLARRPATPTK